MDYYFFLLFVAGFSAVIQLSISIPAKNRNGKHLEQGGHFQGDILNSKEELEKMALLGNGIRNESYRWPNQTIIYQVNRPLSSNQERILDQALRLISSKTCIKFRKRMYHKDYVSIVDPGYYGGCSSYVGKQGGVQQMNLEDACFNAVGVIAHEFMHVLGFEHEQARTDRDDWVTIHWENIASADLYANFENYNSSVITPFGFQYDYGSVMHYGAYDFSKDEKKLKTISTKVAGKPIGQRKELSSTDVAKIKAMYNCK